MEFRPFNVLERMAITSALNKRKLDPNDYRAMPRPSTVVSYERLSGGFTVCLIVVRATLNHQMATVIYRGVSRKSLHDRWNSTRGDMIAFNRALQSKGVELL